jgi:hypothetical protein
MCARHPLGTLLIGSSHYLSAIVPACPAAKPEETQPPRNVLFERSFALSRRRLSAKGRRRRPEPEKPMAVRLGAGLESGQALQ